MAAIRITVRALERLAPTEILRDEADPGFFAEAGRSGAVSFKVQADLRRGPRTGEARARVGIIKMTLGRWPGMSLDAARVEAKRLLAEIKAGRDPRRGTVHRGDWTVGRARDEYAADLRLREKATGTIANLNRSFKLHLSDWLELPLAAVTREMCRARHARVLAEVGPVAANHALRALRTAYNFAKRVHDTPLPENPVDAVTFARERSANRSIAPVDLAGWYAKLQTVSSPARRIMHELGLYSGLRPGNLVALERAWIDFDRHVVVLPARMMKGRADFHLPVSGHIEGLLRRAIALAREQAPQEPWLFPTRDKFNTKWISTQVWKEKTALPSETGHTLRHTYSNAARLAGVDDVDRELLLAHKIPGVQGVYLHTPTLFERLLEQQERVTAYLLAATGQNKQPAQPRA
jgi:integrase